MKKTKIICTVGPASEDRETLKSMMLAGMNGARLNFSHGTYEEHKKKMDLIKELRDELDLHVSLILDTKGPEIRTGQFEKGEIQLKEDQDFILTVDDVLGTDEICSVTYKGLAADVHEGARILIDDGLIGLSVKAVK
jgi:pyruvate kinase